jgi:serine/threonine-protein kinase
MTRVESDRNLLFGVLALQLELIDARQFGDACSGWATQKARPLADLLVERGWITASDRTDVERLLERKLQRHEGDPHASLISTADERARAVLAQVQDPEVRGTLDRLSGSDAHVLLSTIGYTPEIRERYTLTRLHAQGGLGQVWLARDSAFGRDVALKELRPERTGDPGLWGRFLEEARITGQLEHPNIVPVHELGEPGDGKPPFYTMRFVKGCTLSEAIRDFHARRQNGAVGPVEFQALLNAFVGVCNAVGYAHSRGVIHRDLKGQNVVLGDYGEVVVLDWGLAKLVARRDETLTPQVGVTHEQGRGETLAGQALGTPAYMSPEQAEGRWDLVDRRSDIYGLGAILYEILAGTPPFDGDHTADLLRRVVSEPPPPPRSICATVPQPLEAVCLKALAKRPSDRYASAKELADEVRHYLADEPVAAYREPAIARLGRWARRHKPLVASAAVLLLAAVLGLTAGTVLLGQANARTDRQRRLAEASFLRAEANFQKAREAVDEYFTKISESRLLNVPGLQPLRRDLLESARKYYEGFLRERGNDRTVQAEAAEAWYRLGFVQQYVESPQAALTSFERSAVMYEALARARPSEVHYRYKLAMCLNDLGNQQSALGDPDGSLQTERRSLEIREQVARERPGVPEYVKELAIGHVNVGNHLYRLGRLEESLAHERTAQSLTETLARAHPQNGDYRNRFASYCRSVGQTLRAMGRTTEATRQFREGVEVMRALVKEHPEDLQYRASLARSLSVLAFHLYRSVGQLPDALAALEEELPLVEQLARENPGVRGYRAEVANCTIELGRVQERLGQREEALRSFVRARDRYDALALEQPAVAGFRRYAGYSQFHLGRLLRVLGREAESRSALEAALGRFRPFADAEIDPLGFYDLACVRALCAGLVGAGRPEPTVEDQAGRQRYGDRALAALRDAVAGGFKSASMIETDPDFDAIRARPEFQAILAELKAQRPARSTPAVAGP